MFITFFLYLAKASVDIAAFALVYRLFLKRLTHFQWNRWYLLSSLLLSLAFPFLPYTSFLSGSSLSKTPEQNLFYFNIGQLLPSPGSVAQAFPAEAQEAEVFLFHFIGYTVLALYLLGCLYKAWRLFANLMAIKKMIGENETAAEGRYCIIRTQQSLPAFSFMHYIFLQADTGSLSEEELAHVLHHEQVHVDQKHSFDLLLIELAEVFFWFNPAVYYLGAQLREVHEYQVDAAVASSRGNIRKYGELLLKLATQPADRSILHTFSSRQIVHRIHMLTQTKSSPMQKLRFLAVVPAAAITLILSSFFGNDPQGPSTVTTKQEHPKTASQEIEVPIRKISWVGNQAFTDIELNNVLGLRPGDKYSKGQLNDRLNYHPDKMDIGSLYMDNGYMYFNVSPKESFSDNAVDLEFTIQEGPKVKIGEVRISGNKKIGTAEILKKVNIKAGELFSRSKLIAAQQAIAKMGYFDAEQIGINPIPNEAAGTTDVEFVLVEK